MYAVMSWGKPSLALAKATKSGLGRVESRDGIRRRDTNKKKACSKREGPTQTGNLERLEASQPRIFKKWVS